MMNKRTYSAVLVSLGLVLLLNIVPVSALPSFTETVKDCSSSAKNTGVIIDKCSVVPSYKYYSDSGTFEQGMVFVFGEYVNTTQQNIFVNGITSIYTDKYGQEIDRSYISYQNHDSAYPYPMQFPIPPKGRIPFSDPIMFHKGEPTRVEIHVEYSSTSEPAHIPIPTKNAKVICQDKPPVQKECQFSFTVVNPAKKYYMINYYVTFYDSNGRVIDVRANNVSVRGKEKIRVDFGRAGYPNLPYASGYSIVAQGFPE